MNDVPEKNGLTNTLDPRLSGALDEILALHTKWVETDGKEGVRLDLFGKDLRKANLKCADLREADISSGHLEGANLKLSDVFLAKIDGLTAYAMEPGNLEKLRPAIEAAREGNTAVLGLNTATPEESEGPGSTESFADLIRRNPVTRGFLKKQ